MNRIERERIGALPKPPKRVAPRIGDKYIFSWDRHPTTGEPECIPGDDVPSPTTIREEWIIQRVDWNESSRTYFCYVAALGETRDGSSRSLMEIYPDGTSMNRRWSKATS